MQNYYSTKMQSTNIFILLTFHTKQKEINDPKSAISASRQFGCTIGYRT